MLLWQRAFERKMKEALGENLKLVWTRNRTVMVSFRTKQGINTLRLHESFASADESTREDLLNYLRNPKSGLPESVKIFIKEISGKGCGPQTPHRVLRAKGKRFDLRRIFRKLNRTYFDSRLKTGIRWGKSIFSRDKNSITFGSYNPALDLITIHPVLDTPFVPGFYIENVLHHEMTHAWLHMVDPEKNGIHTPRFHALNRKHRYHALATAWEKSHFRKLLQYEPKGKAD